MVLFISSDFPGSMLCVLTRYNVVALMLTILRVVVGARRSEGFSVSTSEFSESRFEALLNSHEEIRKALFRIEREVAQSVGGVRSGDKDDASRTRERRKLKTISFRENLFSTFSHPRLRRRFMTQFGSVRPIYAVVTCYLFSSQVLFLRFFALENVLPKITINLRASFHRPSLDFGAGEARR